MKRSHYDVLQVSTRAVPSVIEAAYKNIKPALAESANNGVDDARNELVFLEEAYSVLSSPERRGLYDRSLTMSEPGVSYRARSLDSSAQESESTFLGWWAHTRTSRFLLALAVFAAVFSVYKFVGQQGDHKVANKQLDVQEKKEVGAVQNDSFRAGTERALVQGAVQNQAVAIDRSYDIQSREAERRRKELEYRANAGEQQLQMQRQRQEAQLQDQRWRQEQYEKDRQAREAQAVVARQKRDLCNIYRGDRRYAEAQAAGC
jgi:curved DNA-binding protein CbpA